MLMGSDMCLQTISFSKGTSMELRRTKMLAATKKVCSIEDWEYYLKEAQDCETIEELKEDATNLINTMFDAIEGQYRDITHLIFAERILILSGGMSRGDDPTTTYALITKFNGLPYKILEAGGVQWHIDPYNTFITHYKLPQKIKKDLKSWRLATKI